MKIAKATPFEGKPSINFPSVYGGCVGKDIICRIPVTGKRPIDIKVIDLPEELKLENGIITGKVMDKCSFNIRISAENVLGMEEKEVKFVIGEDTMLLTPLMGFTSWNAFGSKVSQQKMEDTAKAILEMGIADYGYSYINIDSGWQKEYGGEFDAVIPNEKFPNMKGFCEKMHKAGLKCGIYSTPMLRAWGCPEEFTSIPGCTRGEPNILYTCRNEGIGIERKEKNNVRQWEEWEFDYLKYDWEPCDPINADYMKRELVNASREIAFCVTVDADICYQKYWKKNCASWRCNRDSLDEWNRVKKRLFPSEVYGIEAWKDAVCQGHYYDLDMLEIGAMVWNDGKSRLTENEAIFAYTLRAFFLSPIQLSCRIRELTQFEFDLIANEEMIRLNQDAISDFPELYSKNEAESVLIYKRNLENNDVAFAIFNTTEKNVVQELSLDDFSSIRDLWTKTDVTNEIKKGFMIEPHCVRVLRVSK